jgi:hypothetical protein
VQHAGAVERAAQAVAAAQSNADRAGRRLKRLSDLDDDDPLLTDAMIERKSAMAALKEANNHLEQVRSTGAAREAMARAMGTLIALAENGEESARERLRDILRNAVSVTAHLKYVDINIHGMESSIQVDRKDGLDATSLERLLDRLKARLPST